MITKISPLCFIDFYKADHKRQYPQGTEYVYSNFTPRKSRVDNVNEVLFFGLQYFIKEYLIDSWNEGFFLKPKDEVVSRYKRRMDTSLGPDAVTCEHIGELHDLGYLPIRIKALPVGTLVPMGVPMLTIVNTNPRFSWLTNYLETLMSNILWKPTTSATTAFQYRKKFEEYCEKTGYDKSFVQWQGHDFSNRGMSGMEDAVISGAGHLLSFTGTDTVSAIDFLEIYYGANADKELIGGSVPATEHSIMSLGEKDFEINTFKRLICDLYPNGVVSIVSDTWDFWKVVTEFLPTLRNQIMERNGRVVIRPDSGDPVDIICGYENKKNHVLISNGEGLFRILNTDTSESKLITQAEYKGAYECFWDTFGGVINEKGYKCLDGHIGLIYGDSITLERQDEILRRLELKGFSPSNLVLGIGSYTYEYVTRDTYGFAMKATWGVVNGVEKNIFKDPKTDTGFKKSAKGLLMVYKEDGKLLVKNECTHEEEQSGLLTTVFENGKLVRETSLAVIRERVNKHLSNK